MFGGTSSGSAFNFGASAAPAAATTSAFSFPTAATTATSGFGFSAPAATTATSGFGFAAPAASTATSGFGFAAPAASTAPSGFGFAAPAASTATSGFGFAAPSASTATSGFGFAAPSASTATSGFGFAAPSASTATSGFGFAAPAASTATSGFGFAAPAASAATSGFAFPAPAGGAATSAPFGFGKPAGAAVSSAASFGAGFGAAGKLTLGAFGQTAGVATSAAASAASSVAFFASLTQPALFPDERDSVLARWNQLQAQWGAGKGFCSQGPVEYQPGNPFCRLKSVCYNALPAAKDEDGLVGLTVTKAATEIAETGVKDALFRLLGNKPNLTPHIEEIRALGEKLCQLVVYIREQLPTGGARRILSTELAAYLSQPMNKQQLSTQLQVTAVQALTRPSRDQLTQYLDRPAAGVPLMVWQQARRENPDPESLLPVPLVGLEQAQARMSAQRAQCQAQQRLLGTLAARCERLRVEQAASSARLDAAKRRQLELGRRAVRLLCRQESARRPGQTLLPREEQLRSAVEQLLTQLPTGRLRELASQVKLGVRPADRDSAGGGSAPVAVSASSSGGLLLDAPSLDAVMTHLAGQHRSVGELVRLTNVLARDLDTVQAGLG
ncbi:hypothetical protein BOX15_Mlig014252g2 [Macrostomum lignano]|uniref:Nucleoporin Nup54 alpha-helical domain-containing protein n=1 Tax=Macrostomum lignano TaxID=282301 RepID=A0A267EVV9_9PLAT|nr:hypothetical protein BOX15_Mlig014252g2 [Macrostomum lignano]